jgi:putative salt-induced outer membrane protein
MNKVFALASVIALTAAAPLAAQTALTGVRTLDDRIDDIAETAQTDINRGNDAQRFGPNAVPQGWRGSLAFSAVATDGSANTGEISLASRLTYGVGNWSHSVGLAGEFGRTGSVATKKEFFGTYEASRYFSERFYAFGTGRYEFNEFTGDQHDAFLGFGPGYRIINTQTAAWRVQAGPGARWIKDSAGVTTTEASGILSSRLWLALNDTVSITNDTDVLYSKHGTTTANDLGLNFKMSDRVSTRISYRSNHDSAVGNTWENTAGVSVVVGF